MKKNTNRLENLPRHFPIRKRKAEEESLRDDSNSSSSGTKKALKQLAEDEAAYSVENLDSRVTHHNQPILMSVYNDPVTQQEMLIILCVLPIGATTVRFTLVGSGPEEIKQGEIPDCHPKIIALKEDLKFTLEYLSEAPKGSIELALPIPVQTASNTIKRNDSWAVARSLLRKPVEQSDINTETDSARTSKRKRTPKIPYSPNQSSADGEDSDDKTDSAQGEKQKRKISNQAKKLKLTAKSQKPKKDECRDLSPLRDFDDLSNSENGEETDVPLKKQTNKVQSKTTHSDQSYTNEEDEPLMEDISNQVEKINKQKQAGATKKVYAPSGKSDRGNTQPVSKIAHDSKKAATLTQGGSNSAKPKNAVPRKTQQVYFKEALAYKETGTKSTRGKDKTSSSVCSNALVLRDINNTKPGERLKSSMSNSPVMDFQSKPAATSQVKERFSENAQLAEGSKATSLIKVEKFIIQHLTGISKKNEQRFDSIDVKLDLILEQLLNGVRSVSLEEANFHIPFDSYEEWMDLEKVLANRDTAIALSNKRHSRECQKAGDLNSNDSDMTRKCKQDEDDYEKKNESSDDEDETGLLHNETLESID
ncbi:hypothetical protein OUZ56_025486 [Daphnia magna]|uniref:Uncharacterized protein n=1 Tax=Daphnia magna TaxID=35525 RepID=A0ABQ9ZJZ8_9CRUS|nr:hypothetical protein OUZ56_025486 [Daphnia magna]